MSAENDLWAVELKVERSEKNNIKKRGNSKRQKVSTVLHTDTVNFNFWFMDHPNWEPCPGFEIFIINSKNETIKSFYEYDWENQFSINLDQFKIAGQKISDVTYKIVVNLFEQEEEEPLEDSDEDSDKDSDENSDEDSDY